jgi:predicted AlkP superfamily phosphohydrolase/phosphomutase
MRDRNNWVEEDAQQGNNLDKTTNYAWGGVFSSIIKNKRQRKAIEEAQQEVRNKERALMEGLEGKGKKNWWETLRGWFGRNFYVGIKRQTPDGKVGGDNPEMRD